MELYCRCGYPILVAAHWTGDDLVLRLHDAQRGKDSDEIQSCPECGAELHPGGLERLPPLGMPLPPLDADHARASDDSAG
jgi:hypothetical protein